VYINNNTQLRPSLPSNLALSSFRVLNLGRSLQAVIILIWVDVRMS